MIAPVTAPAVEEPEYTGGTDAKSQPEERVAESPSAPTAPPFAHQRVETEATDSEVAEPVVAQQEAPVAEAPAAAPPEQGERQAQPSAGAQPDDELDEEELAQEEGGGLAQAVGEQHHPE